MDKKKPNREGINKDTKISPQIQPDMNMERTEEVITYISYYEKEYIINLANILSKISINGQKLLASSDIAEFLRVCINYTCTIYMTQIFPDSSIVTKLPDRDSVKEFMAFRKKYMNFPIDAQLNQLREMGIVKQKEQSQANKTTSTKSA